METLLFLSIIFLIGLAFGSFANVLIDRLPKGQNVLLGRSHCDFCGRTLRWFELIPVISFAVQRGRCLRCRKKLSIQYPLVELLTAVLVVFVTVSYQQSYLSIPENILGYIASLVIAFSLFVIFFADLKYQIIPDSMVVLCTAGGLILFVQSPGLMAGRLLSALGAGGFFYLLYQLTRGRGMGFGDVKLALVLGLITGFPMIILVLYAAFLTGAALGVILILGRRKSLKSKIAFGPFLIMGLVIALIWGDKILAWWMKTL